MPADPTDKDRVRVPKTAEVVAQNLRSQIVRGEIPEGGALPSETVLMERFGISRPSLREAFRILESERLLVVRRGSRGGARATKPDIGVAARYLGLVMQFDRVALGEVFVARALIEPLGFRLLADVEDREDATAALRVHLDKLDGTTDYQEYARLWIGFFQLLFSRAGNRPMELLYETLTEVIGTELLDAMESSGDQDDTGPDYTRRGLEKVLTLVEKGKGAEASEFWTKQMLSVSDLVSQHHSGRTLVEVTDAY